MFALGTSSFVYQPMAPAFSGHTGDMGRPLDPQFLCSTEILYSRLQQRLCRQEKWRDYRPFIEGTFAHQQHVALLADKIAVRMGMGVEARENLYIAALFHDIGKTSMDPAVLFKRDNLTAQDRKKINRHPINSARLIRKIYEQNPRRADAVAKIALQHHERSDGRGYPMGLSGAQMSLAASILGIADDHDALTQNRCYKEGFSNDQAKRIISSDAGKKYPFSVFQAYLDVTTPFVKPAAAPHLPAHAPYHFPTHAFPACAM